MHLWNTEICRAVRRQFLRGAEMAGGALAFGRAGPDEDVDETARPDAAGTALDRPRRQSHRVTHLRLVAVGPRGLER
jgi:hypothetical protein